MWLHKFWGSTFLSAVTKEETHLYTCQGVSHLPALNYPSTSIQAKATTE